MVMLIINGVQLFLSIKGAKKGDKVIVTSSSGEKRTFEVLKVKSYPREEKPNAFSGTPLHGISISSHVRELLIMQPVHMKKIGCLYTTDFHKKKADTRRCNAFS